MTTKKGLVKKATSLKLNDHFSAYIRLKTNLKIVLKSFNLRFLFTEEKFHIPKYEPCLECNRTPLGAEAEVYEG